MIKSRVVMRLALLLLFLVLCISAFSSHAWADVQDEGAVSDSPELFSAAYPSEVPARSLVWSFASRDSESYIIRTYAPKTISRTESYFLVGSNSLNGRSACYWIGSWFYARLSLDIPVADAMAPTSEEIASAVSGLMVVMDSAEPTGPVNPTEPIVPTEPQGDRTSIELLASIDYRLGVILAIVILCLVAWFLWTVIGKWFFGSV